MRTDKGDKKNEVERAKINSLTSISNWISSDDIFIEEFFLTRTGYPLLYEKTLVRFEQEKKEAIARGETPDKIKEPIVQLSPKGLSLLMYLFAEKEKSKAQPLIASDIPSLIFIINLVCRAPHDSKVVIIYQPTDNDDPLLYNRHKTVFKIEKELNVLRLINLDSVGPIFGMITLNHLKDAIAPYPMPQFKYLYYSQKSLLKESALGHTERGIPAYIEYGTSPEYTRQTDDYQCGTIAIKDAKQLMRDKDFSEKLKYQRNPIVHPPFSVLEYELPAQYYKVVQSRTFSKVLLPVFGEEVVTRKGRTLNETSQKHQVTEYVSHFSEKYHDLVTKYVNTHDAKEVKKATEEFDASKMTVERLISVYGLNRQEKSVITQKRHIPTSKPPRRP